MKKLYLISLFAFLFACKKDDEVEPAPVVSYGTWRLIPVGLPTDSFFYLIHSSADSVNDLWIGGHVSDGPLEFKTVSGEWFSVIYKDTLTHPDSVNWHTYKYHEANSTLVDFTDSIPATIY